MARWTILVLMCASLCGCASFSSMPSLPSIGGGSAEPEKTGKPQAANAAVSPAATNSGATSSSSSLSSIWTNFSSVFQSGAQPVSQKADDKPRVDAEGALRLINEYRAGKRLPPLSLDPHAAAAAAALAEDMAKHDQMSHFGPNGADVGKRLLAAGYSYHLAAENVGVGQKTVAEIVEGWKKSPPHSKNMLLPNIKHMGIAYEYRPDGKYKTYWTLVLAAP
jgi:uncharacterized protein YkwD